MTAPSEITEDAPVMLCALSNCLYDPAGCPWVPCPRLQSRPGEEEG